MATYRGPGVFSQEIIRSIAPSAIPGDNVVAVVSDVPTSTRYREPVRLTGLDPVELQKQGIDDTSIKVLSLDEYTVYEANTDYSILKSNADPYLAMTSLARINNTATETFTLDSGTNSYQPLNGRGVHDIVVTSGTTTPVTYQEYVDYTYDRYSNKLIALPNGTLPRDGTSITISYSYGIESGEDVIVDYRYADEEYYGHHLFGDFTEVRRVFGDPFNSDGTPNPMSLGASLVFANGGPDTQVMAVPVNPHSTGTTVDEVNLADWQVAFDSIVEDEITMVVETSGLVDVQSYLIQSIIGAAQYNQARMAFMGRDGTLSTITREDLMNYAEAINNQRIVVAYPAIWETLDDISGDVRRIGGQYAAAALAGLHTSIRFQDTATRRGIAGLRSLGPEKEVRLNSASASGLCVVENRKGFMRVRHGVTTAFANVNTREISVVRAKDFLIKSMKESLDRSVIGMLMEPDVDFVVASAATAILDRMAESYVIAEYQTPQVFQDSTDPTRLLLRFEYLPNYPVNEILIEFSITPLGASAIQ